MGEIVDLETLKVRLARVRSAGQSVVLANGAFDLLHVGHVRYLQGAKAQADVLVVAVNSDASVKRAKGASRPVIPEAERAELVAALQCVDYVVLFGEDRVTAVIEALKPDVQAKGTDYTADTVPEAAVVRSYGGRVVIVGDPKNHSTSAIVSKLG